MKYSLFLPRSLRMRSFSAMTVYPYLALATILNLYPVTAFGLESLATPVGYSIGEGNEIIVDQGVVIRELPIEEGKEYSKIAVGHPDGNHFIYDPNQLTLDGVWSGQFGRVLENGNFSPMNNKMKSFFLNRMPWSFGEAPRSLVTKKWLGCEIREGKVTFIYELEVQDKGMKWKVEESPSFQDEESQQIDFKISANKPSELYLNYWLHQTYFRKITTNGQQNQRNRLKNLFPNQKQFKIEFLRKKEAAAFPHGYSSKTIEIPTIEEPFRFEPTDFDFGEDGSVYVSTRTGGIWKRTDENWKLFADGLGEANGIRVSPDGSGVYVMQKPELTFLKDSNGDGYADTYKTAEDRFRFTGQYHEFAYGPRINSEGDLFFSLGLNAGGAHRVVPDGFKGQMTSPLGYRGWVMKKSKDGELSPFAWGLRSPAGIGMNSKDELFVTDNQGDWIPASYLGHVEEGDFLGHPASAWDLPEYKLTPPVMDFRSVNERKEDVPLLNIETLRSRRKLPAVWLAHGDLTNSPGHPSFAPASGFGPFADQAFIADIAHRSITRVALEKVDGAYQGAAFPFIRKLPSCSYSTAFDKEGNLWVGAVGRGWVAGDPMIEVISFKEGEMPFEMHNVELQKGGFDIHFTQAIAQVTIDKPDIKITRFQHNTRQKTLLD